MNDGYLDLNETLLSAYGRLQAGNMAETEHTCRRVLRSDPENPKALHLLALVHCGKADYGAAKDCMEQALLAEPENHFYHYTLGDVYRGLCMDADAIGCYERALSIDPSFVEAWNNLGITLHELGLFERAMEAYGRTLLINPESVMALMNMGNTLMELGRFRDASTYFARVITLDPSFMEAYPALLETFRCSGSPEESLRDFVTVTESGNEGVEVLNSLGTVLQEQGSLEDAFDCFERTLGLDPRFVDGYNNLGLVQKRLGRYEDASESFEKAITLKPDFVEAYNNLGVACYGRGMFDEAKAHFETTIRLREDYATGHTNLGMVLAEEGRIEAARACYEKAASIAPHPGLKVALATLVPVICQSREEIERARQNLETGIKSLLEERLIIDDPIRQIGRANFYLAYQGMGDRSLQEKLAEFYLRICPGLHYRAPHCHEMQEREGRTKIRVGFLSRHLKDHTIGKYVSGIIALLDRSVFEVHTLLFPNKRDETVEFIENHSDTVTMAPESLPAIRRLIAGMKLDILFYPDIGMEPYTYFLAFSRLAPVQCVFYGHPITTGMGTVDYFISHQDCETEEGNSHYTEKLVTLPGSVAYTYYYRPERKGPPKERQDFGLPHTAHLYLCCQSLFKVHPDFDEILKGIMDSDKEALIVFFHGKHASWADLLATRLRKSLGEDVDRVRFLPRYEYDDYLALVGLADVVLDTTHFNGGATTFDALAVGTPVVTLPGEYMRGRQTYALYKRMDLMDCVAPTPGEYVQIALRLANDPSWRDKIKTTILARNKCIFEDMGTIRELERLFKKMVAKTL